MMQTTYLFTRQRRKRLCIKAVVGVVALLSGVAGGCGGGNSGGNVSRSEDVVSTPAPEETRQVVETMQGPLRIVASLPKRVYRKGEVVELTFSVTNTGADAVSLHGGWGPAFGSINFGGMFGQFTAHQGDVTIFDSLPGRGEYQHVLVRAGATVTETLEWTQSDIRDQLPQLVNTYRGGDLPPNTATPGEYQITPKLSVLQYSRYETVRLPDGSQELEYAEILSLNNNEDVKLPPFSVTIEP